MQKKHSIKSFLGFVLSPNNVRRIGPEDAKTVERLTLKNTSYLFGETPVLTHLERNYLSLGAYNDEEELCGVVCLGCHPNIPALPPCEWDVWLRGLYGVEDVRAFDTLWIHYAVWDRRYTTLFLKPTLQSVFQNYEPVENVMMVCPPGIARLDFIDEHATRLLPRGHANPAKVQTVYMATKEDFVGHYVIRRAVEEDNDDLVAIIPEELEKWYGSYYISEILSGGGDDGRQIIVAEHRGKAVGVLCLNEYVNYDLLNEEFELVPYNGLKKHDVADEVLQPQASNVIVPAIEDSNEQLSTFMIQVEAKEEDVATKLEDETSDDEYSLVNLSSSLIFFLYEEEDSEVPFMSPGSSATSIESYYSAIILNEDYQDHLYNADKGGEIEGDERKSLRRKESRQDPIVIPTYYGKPNAFVMEICTALPEHENCLYLLFQAAFQCFPDRAYIVVTFPTHSTNTYLTQHFARVVPRPNSVFSHELYVLHKSAVLGKLAARVSRSEDKQKISELVTTFHKPSIIEDQFREAVDARNSPLRAYTFLCDRQVIGCAKEQEYEYLSVHYDIDTWVGSGSCRFGTIGSLEEFIISPIFQRHVSFFTRELYRLSSFDTFFYRLKRYDYMYAHRTSPIANLLMNMIPVVPNPVPEYSQNVREEYVLPQSLQRLHQPFGLYVSTTRICSIKKIEINQRIVIVGAGATTISFLEALIFSRNPNCLINFTNITVVSPHGISYHNQPSRIREMIFVSDGHLDRRYLDSLCLKTYVHVITGVMTSINRKEKYIGLNEDSHTPYDYLFLLCGEQFQKPPQKKKEIVRKRVDFPQNVFMINTEADAGNAFNALKNLMSGQKQGTIVVFGHYLEAICCLAALIEFGVLGSNLVYIDPSPEQTKLERHEHLTQFFNNSSVETAVLDEMLLQGVTIYQDYNFVEWSLNATKNSITSAKFESKYKFVEIELTALFIYYAKSVSTKTFQAIARSGLVFNGKLVIDENYQTNDPCIFGAGSLTMYSKRYYAEHLMHKYYNSREIGYMLAEKVKRKLLPQEYWDPPTEKKLLREPVVKFCKFPGNLSYLHVSQSGPPVPLDVAMNKCNYGTVLTTGDCKKLDKQGFFRLHLNQFQTVETITCLTKFELNVKNLTSLWGKHEVLLNHLLLRYDNNMIQDLFAYFSEPWACALYHKCFPRVLDDIDEMLHSAVTTEGELLTAEVKARLEKNEWRPLTRMQTDEIEEMCRDINLLPQIQEKVLDFLHQNYTFLPMYAHQLLIRWIIHQTNTSPLFIKTIFVMDFLKKSIMQGPHGVKEPSYFRKTLPKKTKNAK